MLISKEKNHCVPTTHFNFMIGKVSSSKLSLLKRIYYIARQIGLVYTIGHVAIILIAELKFY